MGPTPFVAAVEAGSLLQFYPAVVFGGDVKPGLLVRLIMEDGQVQGEDGEHIRDVQQGPNDFIYLLTDNHHWRILRVMEGAVNLSKAFYSNRETSRVPNMATCGLLIVFGRNSTDNQAVIKPATALLPSWHCGNQTV